jgi:uncharacterized Zn-finger protein
MVAERLPFFLCLYPTRKYHEDSTYTLSKTHILVLSNELGYINDTTSHPKKNNGLKRLKMHMKINEKKIGKSLVERKRMLNFAMSMTRQDDANHREVYSNLHVFFLQPPKKKR